MAEFKCSRCKCVKEEKKFGLNKNDNRNKTCIKCNKQRIKYNKMKKNYKFEMSADWTEHPKLKGYYGNKNGLIVCQKTKRLVGSLMDSDYIMVGGSHQKWHILAHRFIWETFNGLIENPKLIINHMDEDKSNNELKNLELISHSENSQKATKCGKEHLGKSNQKRMKPCIGVNQKTEKEYSFVSLSDAKRKTDCNQVSIMRCCDGIQNTVQSKSDKSIWIFKYV